MSCSFQIARWSKVWQLIQESDCDPCTEPPDLDPNSDLEPEVDPKVREFLMERSILKVHLPNGGFNMVKYGDATDVKVSGDKIYRYTMGVDCASLSGKLT